MPLLVPVQTSHDYLHHGVFKGDHNKLVHWNNVVGYAIGTWQGYVVGWWRARHNTHHVCTNEIGNDPDIKTAPILVFVRNTKRIAEKLNSAQRWQQYYYVPVMAILDVYWRLEGLAYLVMRPLSKTWLSWTLMGVHYATLYWVFQVRLVPASRSPNRYCALFSKCPHVCDAGHTASAERVCPSPLCHRANWAGSSS